MLLEVKSCFIRTPAVTTVDDLPSELSEGNVGKCAVAWAPGWLVFWCFWESFLIVLNYENNLGEHERILSKWAY